LDRFGRLPISQVLAPAIRLAQEGFLVAPVTAHFWERSTQRLNSTPGGSEMTIDGRAPRAGEIFRNRGLAHTLQKIAEGGRQAFYQGEIAEAIASVVQQSGGCLSVDDLAAHTSTREQPISTTDREFRVWECPPNGQGLATLLVVPAGKL
jgi:gamma-glutamyltranspeptidase/glutathione hydrolase